ncbi:MAG TPA: alcohol dehydrogenase catalytic domain-containing protein [Thermoanaerobaculia bacterium]|nr:alcohol dehydrogenase catalytic domain-containing protein [Thermoanaerobaculia bacterium]
MSDRYRSVFLTGAESLEVREVPVPRPGPGEIVVRIAAATTCGTDVKVFRRGGHPRMLTAPCAFGHEMSGAIESVGSGVSEWAVGDEVIVGNSASCGDCPACHRSQENLCIDLQYLNGAFAELVLVPRRFARRSLYRKPGHLSFEAAAITEPLACVVHGREKCDLRGPSRVGVLGAGPIGLLFVQLLAREGHDVVALDPNQARLDVARSMGAAAVLTISRDAAVAEVETQELHELDLVIEATGSPEAWKTAMKLVRPGGEVLLFGGCAPGTEVPLDTHWMHYSEITVRGAYHHRPSTFEYAIQLLADRTIEAEKIISASCSLDGVGGALRSMMEKKTLKVVVTP